MLRGVRAYLLIEAALDLQEKPHVDAFFMGFLVVVCYILDYLECFLY